MPAANTKHARSERAGTRPISIVIADDHPVFRMGLCELIRNTPHFHLAGEASDGAEAERLIRELRPDVAVLDVEMPHASGLDVAFRLFEDTLRIGVVILTMYTEDSVFNRAIDLGIKGYILKDAATSDIILAIERVAAGEYFFSSSLITRRVTLNREGTDVRSKSDFAALTQAERQVFRLLGRSLSSREIADELCVSIRTVEHHRYNICHKLGLNGTFALVRYVLAHPELV